MKTPFSKVVEIINHRVNGCGLRQTARVCNVSRMTVEAVSLRVGEACARFLDGRLRDLQIHQIQADELHTTVGAKQRHLREDSPPEYGDCWGFVAQDAVSRAIISYRLGDRDFETTLAFAQDLGARIVGRPHITTDAFKSYQSAFEQVFGDDIDYMQLVKKYAGTKLPNGHKMWTLKSATLTPKIGEPDRELSSTSYIERLFATLRGRLSKYGRRSAQFGKRRRNLSADLSLFAATYNFVCVHSTIRATPAQALGLTDRPWTIAQLIDFAMSEPEPEPLQFRPPAQSARPQTRNERPSRPMAAQRPDEGSDATDDDASAVPTDLKQYRRDRALLIKVSASDVDNWMQAALSVGMSIREWVNFHLDAASKATALGTASPETRARIRRPPPLAVFTLWFPNAPIGAWRDAAQALNATFTSWVQHHLDAAAAQAVKAAEERLVVGT